MIAKLLPRIAGLSLLSLSMCDQPPPTPDIGTAIVVEAPVAPMVNPVYLAAMAGAHQNGVDTWDAIADCESGDRTSKGHVIRGTANWSSTVGRYEGGVQFLHSTWVTAGGRIYAEHAYQATRTEQIDIAQNWLEHTNWKQWPQCSRIMGYR